VLLPSSSTLIDSAVLPHSIWGYARGRNGVTADAAERPCCHGAVKAFFDASVARLNPCGGPVLRIGCRCPSLTRSEVGIDRNSMRPDVGSAQNPLTANGACSLYSFQSLVISEITAWFRSRAGLVRAVTMNTNKNLKLIDGGASGGNVFEAIFSAEPE
jgi:hypothetical protein